MNFEWYENKNLRNQQKHGISFELAKEIFESFTLSAIDNRESYGELREISIGSVSGVLMLVVVHTERNGNQRIISARKALKQERKYYEEALRKTFGH